MIASGVVDPLIVNENQLFSFFCLASMRMNGAQHVGIQEVIIKGINHVLLRLPTRTIRSRTLSRAECKGGLHARV